MSNSKCCCLNEASVVYWGCIRAEQCAINIHIQINQPSMNIRLFKTIMPVVFKQLHPEHLSTTAGPLGIMMQCAVIGISVGKQLPYPRAQPHAVLETV